MEQELLKNGSLRIFVSKRELDAFGIRFETLDIRTERTRAFLTAVLLAANATAEMDLSRLTIEALPTEEGCLLLLTPLWATPRKLRSRRAESPLVYHFASTDALLALAKGWKRLYPAPHRLGNPLGASSLYAFADGYRLVLSPVSPLSRAASVLLDEWGVRAGVGDAAAAFAAEHGKALCVGDALPRLCG